MKKITTLVFSLFTIACAAQSSDKYPFYSNSAVLEFASPWIYFNDLSRKNPTYTAIKLPATFIAGEFRIKNKFYLEGGLKYGFELESVSISWENAFHYREFGGTCYAGGLFKLKLFRNFYFTPSLDFYYSRVKRFYNNTLSENSSYYSLGPTIGFEYFISKRISLNTDLLNINWGLRSDSEHPTTSGRSYATVYKSLSLGIHYNFDWKKKN